MAHVKQAAEPGPSTPKAQAVAEAVAEVVTDQPDPEPGTEEALEKKKIMIIEEIRWQS